VRNRQLAESVPFGMRTASYLKCVGEASVAFPRLTLTLVQTSGRPIQNKHRLCLDGIGEVYVYLILNCARVTSLNDRHVLLRFLGDDFWSTV
jgi:hypothetical protein